ncbi:uncharacterized protein [Amphiura filiformis]|uniref:uncharacterized protein n=1 Tax=Amphiura filiformis TaxID=82378 RepID=UPI003B210CD9
MRCVALDKICNGEDDCRDNSDETDCPTTTPVTEPPITTASPTQARCDPGYRPCSDEGPCIEESRFCDSSIDCTETLIDEKDHCPCPRDGDVRCDNTRCIDPDKLCDEVDDCGDNSDEAKCSTTMKMAPTTELPSTTDIMSTSMTTEASSTIELTTEASSTMELTTESDPCDPGFLPCSSDGPCIEESRFCDGLVDCRDTFIDERDSCPCPRDGEIRCDNARCINPDKLCDGKDDCDDNSDETDCSTTMPMEPTTESPRTTDILSTAMTTEASTTIELTTESGNLLF